jgi:hypothetical protein
MPVHGRVFAIETVVDRVCGEFLEMPGLCLTLAQAQRLWGLDACSCQKIMDLLVEVRFLCDTRDGKYRRLSDGSVPTQALRMAKARIKSDGAGEGGNESLLASSVEAATRGPTRQ